MDQVVDPTWHLLIERERTTNQLGKIPNWHPWIILPTGWQASSYGEGNSRAGWLAG